MTTMSDPPAAFSACLASVRHGALEVVGYRTVTPWLVPFVLFFLFLAATSSTASEVTFATDVMAVLSKAGCNAGTCHGNQHGKGGLHLSLRGQDPRQDYFALVSDLGGRRIDRVQPAESLILRKPTTQVPHEGGHRFSRSSLEYEILREWIAAGAPPPGKEVRVLERIEVVPSESIVVEPDDTRQLKVTAHFSDGHRRDVTALAVYDTSNLSARVSPGGLVQRQEMGETTVVVRFLDQQRPVRLAFLSARPNVEWSSPPASNYVDRLVHRRLRQLRINPSGPADDHVFVRRAYLDCLGVLPTSDEARNFVADPRPDKRTRLIDELLSRPEFAEHWALKWSDLLRNEEKVLDPKGVDVFYAWIRDSFARGQPLDQFVRELVAGRGSTYEHPAANYYRALRDPMSRAETTARLFLGVRLQCAKCHNHPFDRWTQDDYYSWAAIFAQVDYKIVENKRKDKLDKNEFQGEQIVQINPEGTVRDPRTMQDAPPRFLGDLSHEISSDCDRLRQVADWLTSPTNRDFARAQANRIVYHVLGRGLVEPIDDFRATNPESVPGLLDALADDFVRHGFDVRHLVRVLMGSRTYQMSSQPAASNGDDGHPFSRATIRRLTAEQLLDAQCQVLEVAVPLNGYPLGTRPGQVPGVQRVRPREKPPAAGDRFLTAFGKPKRFISCECERSNETTLTQALMLISGEGVDQRLTQSSNRLARMASSERDPAELLDELYWAALSRPPTPEEREAMLPLLEPADQRLHAWQDIAWALLNSKEFLFRW